MITVTSSNANSSVLRGSFAEDDTTLYKVSIIALSGTPTPDIETYDAQTLNAGVEKNITSGNYQLTSTVIHNNEETDLWDSFFVV